MEVLKPSQVLRRIKAGTLINNQPGKPMCEQKHPTECTTRTPSFWENGAYIHCEQCGGWVLARPVFEKFEIDLSGERKKYPTRHPSLNVEEQQA